jgi:NAD(P)-dependent dehydrogenase (short-subunit alcohol dehydrogenase family)
MTRRILILGGYGNFGSHIAKKLAAEKDLEVVVAGRSADKAKLFAEKFRDAPNPVSWRVMDIEDNLSSALAAAAPDIVIHTSGPFQAQGYRVAEACIEQGCHYIDLADGRAFVSGIGALDERARAKNVAVISGASTVPCLTAAIIDDYLPQFGRITDIDYAITTAQHTNLGLATTSAILSYTGKPFTTLKDGRMQRVYGWQDLRARTYPGLGRRWLGNCDIPDLALFPERYPDLQTLRFRAGAEIALLHFGLLGLSWLVRWGLIRSLERYAGPLLRISRWFDALGTGNSGFHMTLSGTDKADAPLGKTLYIIARSGHGPYIPSMPAILCAKMLARGDLGRRGAFPCMGFISLSQYIEALTGLNIEIMKT